MKKKYMRPTLEVVASQLNGNLLNESNDLDWGGAKGASNGVWDEDQNDEDGQALPKNLWDD